MAQTLTNQAYKSHCAPGNPQPQYDGLLDYWEASLRRFPDKIAVCDAQQQSYTYRQVEQYAERLAGYLQKVGVKPGEVVSCQLPNWVQFYPVLVACWKVGAILNPMLTSYRRQDLLYLLQQCESKLFIIPTYFRSQDFEQQTVAVLAKLDQQIPVLAVAGESGHPAQIYPKTRRCRNRIGKIALNSQKIIPLGGGKVIVAKSVSKMRWPASCLPRGQNPSRKA